ncbi:hypothetical protein LCD52_21840 [Rossellomorea vietnamensis]|uniref:hypothetical protein n=1 Tax=Rossellomorea vietnamensis TaxID=218284 RepID=UPI001CCE1086|nr:hypothetical protein [Rossellomorea vietnamensis]MCA0151346.1 hypothetical protein [Rossellomorea vietnamensis]
MDIFRDYKIIKVLKEAPNKSFIVLGMLYTKWNGVIEYPKKLKAEKVVSMTKSDITFLFYRVSPPTTKEKIFIEKELKCLDLEISLSIIKPESDDFKSEKLLYTEIIDRNLKRIELSFNNEIEKLKLIQLGQVYGEFYSNVMLMEKGSYTNVVFYSY